MTPRPPPHISVCPPPADPGSAAVVAHAAESSSGAGTSAGITRCHSCGASVAHHLMFSACMNRECDAPYYRLAQSTEPVTLEQFAFWLEKKAHAASCVIAATEPGFSWSRDVYMEHGLVIDQCQSAIQLLMQFQQEHSA